MNDFTPSSIWETQYEYQKQLLHGYSPKIALSNFVQNMCLVAFWTAHWKSYVQSTEAHLEDAKGCPPAPDVSSLGSRATEQLRACRLKMQSWEITRRPLIFGTPIAFSIYIYVYREIERNRESERDVWAKSLLIIPGEDLAAELWKMLDEKLPNSSKRHTHSRDPLVLPGGL